MAVVFLLSVECGDSSAQAEAVAKSLQFAFALSNGERCDTEAGVSADGEGPWWAIAAGTGLPRNGGGSLEEARLLSAAGSAWYSRLREGPEFGYGIVGLESEAFATESELLVGNSSWLHVPGLVMLDRLWIAAGSPPGFELFRPGYRWLPYKGESWRDPTTGKWTPVPYPEEISKT